MYLPYKTLHKEYVYRKYLKHNQTVKKEYQQDATI